MRRITIQGKIHPEIQVRMKEIILNDKEIPSIAIYDTDGELVRSKWKKTDLTQREAAQKGIITPEMEYVA
ncbi:MAG: hypothetical protein FWB90_04455, partial [Fibromonadales bacterium]|nr:hypothetical protein [Fibromonadales bacterium]